MIAPADHVDVLVIGAGQAGLGTAYHLVRKAPGARVLVLDAEHVGAAWERRWDSLRLFTPRRFSALPGLVFTPGPDPYPTRLEMAAYLRRYAARHRLPVRTGVRVHSLTREADLFRARTPTGDLTAHQVVVAGGPFSRPWQPDLCADLGSAVPQLHSAHYLNPNSFPHEHVVVVGGGNSAAQLAVELAAAGRTVHVAAPRSPWYVPAEILGINMYRWIWATGILNAGADSAVSRYLRSRGELIVGTELRERIRAGALTLTTSRVVGARPGVMSLADGTDLPVEAVLWCTGYRADTSWIAIAGALGPDGSPHHRRGASPVHGLHWMGLPWQTRLNSSIIDGVDRDAHRTARRIVAQLR